MFLIQPLSAQRDIIMPLSQPFVGTDGTTIKEIPIPAGTSIVIGIQASNLNKNVWGDDVLEFKPERWMSALPETVTESHIPGVYSNLLVPDVYFAAKKSYLFILTEIQDDFQRRREVMHVSILFSESACFGS